MGWNVDNAHSQVEVVVRHMMISNVKGHFEKFTVNANIDEDNVHLSQVEVQIDAASINTKMEQREEDHGRIIGDLTIRDVTREVVLNVDYAGQARSPFGTINAGFTGTAKVSRKDW